LLVSLHFHVASFPPTTPVALPHPPPTPSPQRFLAEKGNNSQGGKSAAKQARSQKLERAPSKDSKDDKEALQKSSKSMGKARASERASERSSDRHKKKADSNRLPSTTPLATAAKSGVVNTIDKSLRPSAASGGGSAASGGGGGGVAGPVAVGAAGGADGVAEVRRGWRYRKGRWMYVVLKDDIKKDEVKKVGSDIKENEDTDNAKEENEGTDNAKADRAITPTMGEEGKACREQEANSGGSESCRGGMEGKGQGDGSGSGANKKKKRRPKGKLTMPKKRAYLKHTRSSPSNMVGEGGVSESRVQTEESGNPDVNGDFDVDAGGDLGAVGGEDHGEAGGGGRVSPTALRLMRKMLHRLVRRIHYTAFICP
jgi:hypothetical protein